MNESSAIFLISVIGSNYSNSRFTRNSFLNCNDLSSSVSNSKKPVTRARSRESDCFFSSLILFFVRAQRHFSREENGFFCPVFFRNLCMNQRYIYVVLYCCGQQDARWLAMSITFKRAVLARISTIHTRIHIYLVGVYGFNQSVEFYRVFIPRSAVGRFNRARWGHILHCVISSVVLLQPLYNNNK